jgi:hypothetical protein
MISEDLRNWFGKGGTGGVGGGGWDRYNSSGDRIGKCGDAKEGDAYSACLSKEKARKLGKAGRAAFVKRKRAAQKKGGDAKKGGERTKGQKPIKVKTSESMTESVKLFLEKNIPTNPSKWSYYKSKAKKKFDVYPSAYANAWAAKQYKAAGGKWKSTNEATKDMCTECAIKLMESLRGAIISEAEYNGRTVKLNKPMRGDVKKYKVYVTNDKGNVVKVNFGDPNMSIKRDDPERRKSFRARHKCDQKKDKTTAGYWSCKMWSTKPVSQILKGK